MKLVTREMPLTSSQGRKANNAVVRIIMPPDFEGYKIYFTTQTQKEKRQIRETFVCFIVVFVKNIATLNTIAICISSKLLMIATI